MHHRLVVRLFLLSLATCIPSASRAQPIELEPLVARPFCEASAGLAAPWDDDLILVADNEVNRQLYAFEIDDDDGLLAAEVSLAMPGGGRPRDIEALAQVGSSLLVVGSHSRNSRCEERTNRQRLRVLQPRADGSLEHDRLIDSEDSWAAARQDEAACLLHLFGDSPPELAGPVCDALLDAEEAVQSGSCETLNIEGAFGTRDGRAWLGLRAPLVDGQAVLVRLAPDLTDLRFDRVTLLDLEGRGIRELAVAGDTVYAIAGPPADSAVPFALFAAELDTVLHGGPHTPSLVRSDLPTSSEGMTIMDGRAYVLVDGDEGDEIACAMESRQFVLDIP